MQARLDIPVDVLYKPREHITLTEAEKLLGKKELCRDLRPVHHPQTGRAQAGARQR